MGIHGGTRFQEISEMKLNVNFVFFVLIIVVVVSAAEISAADKGDGDLLKVLAKERKEMSNIFQQENAELRRDDQKLRERDEKLRELGEKLHERIDKLTEQIGRQNEKITGLHGKNDEQAEQITKLQSRNKKLQDEVTKLHNKLRRSDLKVIHLQKGLKHDRQKDQQNQTSEFDKRIKQLIRQRDVHFELKKVIKNEINHFLINEKICVSGAIGGDDGSHKEVTTTHHVNFGYTFMRKPTVSVAMSYFQNKYTYYNWAALRPRVTKVTNSSAEISVRKKDVAWSVSWTACL